MLFINGMSDGNFGFKVEKIEYIVGIRKNKK